MFVVAIDYQFKTREYNLATSYAASQTLTEALLQSSLAREFMKLQSNGGMETRARKKLNLIAPDQRGWRGKKVATKIQQIWNSIPLTIKMENNAVKAKKALKIFYNDM